MNEIEWIVELEEYPHYFISTKGRVLSEYIKGGQGKTHNTLSQLISTKDKHGYFKVSLQNKKTNKRDCKYIHQLVCKTFNKRVEDKNIELGYQSDSTGGDDVGANGGGVTLLSTDSNKEIKCRMILLSLNQDSKMPSEYESWNQIWSGKRIERDKTYYILLTK